MSSNTIVLTSSDGEPFEVKEVVARKLQIVRHMIEDDCVINEIPLQNVTGNILAKVLEYCKEHVDDVSEEESEEAKKEKADSTEKNKEEEAKEEVVVPTSEDDEKKKLDLETWDAEFMKSLDIETIFSIILAANYLNVKGLLDLTCQTVADYIKDKTVEEVRSIFNVVNDYTPEEEAEVRKENAWAFETKP